MSRCHGLVTRDGVTCHARCHAPVTPSRPDPTRPVYIYRGFSLLKGRSSIATRSTPHDPPTELAPWSRTVAESHQKPELVRARVRRTGPLR